MTWEGVDNIQANQSVAGKLGWPEGFEPSNVRVTVVCVDRFTMATILRYNEIYR